MYIYYNKYNYDNSLRLAKTCHINNDGKNAICYYKIKLKDSINSDECINLINIAKIYHYGSENTLPDVEQAILYYNLFLDHIDNNYLHDEYNCQYKEVINILKDIKKVKEENIDIDINDYYAPLTVETFVEDPLIEPIIRPNVRRNMAPIEPLNNRYQLDIQQDPQNVHDTGINNSVTNGLELLTNNTEKKYSYNDIKQFILYSTPEDKLDNINKVLLKIETCNITKDNKSLKDVLTLVGNNIYNSKDQEYKTTGISNLINELDDSVEKEQVVCFTGVHNRIVNSLNQLHPNIQIKDRDSINQEMLNKASAIRNNLEKTIDSNDFNFDEKLKEKIKEEFNKDYINSGILKQDQLNEIIQPWIDHI